jgi:hypothetical protein
MLVNRRLSRALLAAAALGVAALSGGQASAQATKAKPAAEAGGIVGMRRLTEGEYRRSISDIFGGAIKVQGRFEPEVRRDGLIAIGSGQASITSSGMEQYYAIASGISAQVLKPSARKTYVTCTPASAQKPDDACATKFFAQYGRLLYRRPLADKELKALASTARQATIQSKDFYVGLEETLTSMLASPHFLFRVERASGTADNGLAALDNYSRASRLSFLFWDAPPDDELLLAAQKGDLSTPTGLGKQVDRLAASPRLTDGISAFFDDMLQFDLFRTQTKDATRFPKYSQVVAEEAKQQTLRTIVTLLVDKKGDYRDIFTTRDTFMTRTLAMIYKVPYMSNAAWAPYSFPAQSDRAGVLTQVSFLSLFAHPAQSSPTKRGLALNEIFFCQTVPPPPNDVDFSAVNGAGPDRKKTARLRLEQHRTNPSCASCHVIMDPLGLTLEKYDALGQYREIEDGEPIDVASEYARTKFDGASGLGKVMHDEPAVPACVVRNLYSTGTGRAPTGPDFKTVQDLTRTFVEGGYRVPAFLKAMATSDAFFTAPATPKPAAMPSATKPASPAKPISFTQPSSSSSSSSPKESWQ